MTPPPDRIFTGNVPIVSAPASPSARGAVQPLYLLADSQLLFRPADDGGSEPWLRRVVEALDRPRPTAAYLGASNGDRAEYAELFVAAMEGAGVPASRCRVVPARAGAGDAVADADLVLLAGGDPRAGWTAFGETGVREAVVRAYHAGAALVGISAGAMQLGLCAWPDGCDDPAAEAFPTWGLVPFVVGAHEEGEDWRGLRAVVAARGPGARGIGLPRGGGLVYHPDHTVEAVRHPAVEVERREEALAVSFLLPRA